MARIYQDLADTQSIADSIAGTHSLGLGDNIGIVDSIYFDLLVLEDTLSVLEGKSLNASKVLADAIAIADTNIVDTEFTEEVYWNKIKYNCACHAGI
jgi:hypothetical protein